MKEEIRNMPDKQRIGILGAGTWGMALARMLADCDKEVTVWSALPQEVEQLRRLNLILKTIRLLWMLRKVLKQIHS